MIIEQFKVKRFGGHEVIDFNCNSSLVGVFGANGAGKSTLLEALKFAITGQTDQTLDSYVKDLHGSASVFVRFRKGGRIGEIERHIGSKNKRTLTWDNQTITKVVDVNARMKKIFGADKEAVANAVFISQGQMQAMLFSGSAPRRDAFVELLNLSFCAARAEMLMQKIAKLQATMVDLGPARDAALQQRDVAANAYLEKKRAAEVLPDWKQEMDCLAEAATAEAELRVFTAQYAQAETDLAVVQSALGILQKEFQVNTFMAASVAAHAAASALREQKDKLEAARTVQSDLTHYDRVKQDIANLYAELKEVQARIKEVDPSGLGLPAWQALMEKAQMDWNAWDDATKIRAQLQERAQNWQFAKSKYNVAVPDLKGPDLDILFNALTALRAEISLQHKNWEMQKEIANCCTEIVAGGQLRCPKCDLTILDANRLSAEELNAMEKHLQILRNKELEQASTYHNGSLALRIHDETAAAFRAAEAAYEMERQRLQSKLDNYPVLHVEAVAQARKTSTITVEVLKTADADISRIKKQLGGKNRELANYPLALKYADHRSDYADSAIATLAARVSLLTTNNDNWGPVVSRFRETGNEINRLLEVQRNLDLKIKACRQVLEGDKETEQLKSLRKEIFDFALLRAEVSARHQQWVIARAGVAQLEEVYNGTNIALHNVEDRMKKDEVKRLLIKDLLRLRELLDNDGLPLSFSRLHFQRLAVLAQESLIKLQANFSIALDPNRDLAFVFTRIDKEGVELPMFSLSGGQRVRLCVAFLIAVQKYLVPDVGLLVLDEPTTSVDEGGRIAIAEFLVGVGQELQNSEMQIWVCDHSAEVKQQINCKIEL